MKTGRIKYFLMATLLVLGCMVFGGCDYARMKEQESLNTYETKLPDMPKGTIPVTDGTDALRVTDPQSLQNPLPYDAQWVVRGKEAYGYYCIMCHGPGADGNGTVGQSFYPLPTDLRSPYVQEQSDGLLFYKLTFGFKKSPPLGTTAPQQDLWAIIHYLRSLTNPAKG